MRVEKIPHGRLLENSMRLAEHYVSIVDRVMQLFLWRDGLCDDELV